MTAPVLIRQLVSLRLLKNMTARAFRNGVMAFGSVDAMMRADADAWLMVDDLKRVDPGPLRGERMAREVEHELERAHSAGVSLIAATDEKYPALLKEIYDPPFLLYVKGVLPESSVVALAVVGSREASSAGLRLSKLFSRDFASSGAVVVSGLARGVDTMAHEGALEAKGKTVAVLGCGLGMTYPPENKKLAQTIVSLGGAVLSEFPMNAKPLAHHFPMRNRIISGLSRAVVVIEARPQSGALITADAALEQGRDVYAVPGSVEMKQTAGSNRLIQQGARVAVTSAEVLSAFGLKAADRGKIKKTAKKPVLSAEEKKLVSILKHSAKVAFDDIVEQGDFPPGRAMSLLTQMTLKGVVRELPGKYFEEV